MRITEHARTQVAGVAERWKNQYFRGGKWSTLYQHRSAKVVYQQLCALPVGAGPQDVDRIIGNDGWTGYHCSECDQKCDQTILVGDEPDYESQTVYLCSVCVDKLVELRRQLESVIKDA